MPRGCGLRPLYPFSPCLAVAVAGRPLVLTTRTPAGVLGVVAVPSEAVIDLMMRGGTRTPSLANVW